MGLDQAYLAVGSAGDVQNVNAERTDSFWNTIFGPGGGYNTALANMNTYSGALTGLAQQAQGINYDPNAYFGMFNAQLPQFQSMVNQALTPFGRNAGSYADLAANQTRQAVEGQYAHKGNLYSGGFAEAASQGMAMPYYQAAMQEAQMRSGMLGDLWKTALPMAGQQYANSVNTKLQGIGMAGDIYGNLYGGAAQLAGANLGAGASLAAPEWWQPSYVENPGHWANWAPQLTGGVIGGVLGLPGVGEALGGAISNWLTPSAPAGGGFMGPTLPSTMADTANWWQTAHM